MFRIYPLNAGNHITEQFTTSNYSQNVTDYPKLDRDNVNDSPNSTKHFKSNSSGKVTTNDLKKSITKETIDKLQQMLVVVSHIKCDTFISRYLNYHI